jgi:SAM-dependent methyltransferase
LVRKRSRVQFSPWAPLLLKCAVLHKIIREYFMNIFDRWRRAQEYEQGYWENVAQRIAEGSYDRIDFYEWRAGEIRKYLQSTGKEHILDGSSRIIEMGSGPLGVIGYLPGVNRVAIDPLNKFYSTNEHLCSLRNPSVEYISAPGEDVPLETSSCDFLIIENCIDHVQDMKGVMGEIYRLLKPGGILYLTVNARSGFGYYIHRILAKLALDPGHPHTFTEHRLYDFIESSGFELLMNKKGSWFEAWIDDLKEPGLKTKLKALLFVSEYLVTTISSKR